MKNLISGSLKDRIDARFKQNKDGLEGRILLTKTSRIGVTIFRLIFLLMMCFVVLYPLMYMLSVSLRQSKDLYDPTVIWIPRNWTIENYKAVWELIEYPKVLLETFQLTAISTIINVFVCALVGYGFARYNFRGKKLWFGLVIFTLMVPTQTISIPMYVQYVSFDFFFLGQIGRLFTGEAWTMKLLDTPLVYYLPAAFGQGIRSGLFIFIFRQFFRGMPKELEDAAYIDGCGVFATFIRIMIPCAVPAFVTSILFSSVWYWNDYYMASMYFSDANTLAVSLGTLADLLRSVGFNMYDDPYVIVTQMQSACMLTIFPLIVLFIVMQRKFTESIDKTGIVG
ncbi:MAG: carbohydrate ABC transporter permease [Clostridiales bacterium]|nr:carbohydrate ABC transporter permease [Clostridiales bacterium]